MSVIERQLQLCLNKRQQWTTDNGKSTEKGSPLRFRIVFGQKSYSSGGYIWQKATIRTPSKKNVLGALNYYFLIIGNTEWGSWPKSHAPPV